ncbi:hypothetical protein OTU49_015239 [Cherax quadricarinatus]|uniref:Exonuclease domain-containing protein n=2 Tax=Cherax quadricarinatus TaxID=27406 RepID=A0AAW0YIP2_CHEQU
MKTLMSQTKIKRLENKKRKLSAYLDLVERNKEDQIKLSSKNHEEEAAGGSHLVKHPHTDEELENLKRRKREIDKEKMNWPKVFLSSTGEHSNLSLNADKRVPLHMSDVQSFLLYSLIHKESPRIPKWVKMVHTRKFSHIITTIIEGVSLSDFAMENKSSEKKAAAKNGMTDEFKNLPNDDHSHANKRKDSSDAESSCSDEVLEGRGSQPKWLAEALPRTSSLMHAKLELMAPSRYNLGPFEELLSLPSTVKLKYKMKTDFKDLKEAEENNEIYQSSEPLFSVADNEQVFEKNSGKVSQSFPADEFDRRSLLLSVHDMIKYNFPLPAPDCPGYEDPKFIFTQDKYNEVEEFSPMFAVDCEMCLTDAQELELTRISVVNEERKLIYHTLVKPENTIINYLTQYSGITESILDDVTTTLQDVHRDLRELLPPDAILVGHSLHSDLRAMKMMHPYVIDSSLVYNLSNVRNQRSSLKLLAKLFLGEDIQNNECGHDPIEDASASLKLIQLKLKNDIKFGDVILDGDIPNSDDEVSLDEIPEYKEETEAQDKAPRRYITSLFQSADSLDMAMLTTPTCMESYDKILSFIEEKISYKEVLPDNKQLSVRVSQICKQKKLTYVHMKMDTRLDKCNTPESRQHQFTKLDKQLLRIYESAAAKALIIYIFTGSSLSVPSDQRCNGLFMYAIKALPCKR